MYNNTVSTGWQAQFIQILMLLKNSQAGLTVCASSDLKHKPEVTSGLQLWLITVCNIL